ncbi:FMN-linked oxidoreductase [Parathielavia hyrcaniae]|uniref:FMN-linked oxidoreductase n=1 Tax=Parathielavia hyrcaniae TaxID=113614 RepID=A0AAN6Q1H0_9PEZI|nr:FMN-linked oxidoreductase [Parathielavia hyrcaniae]
MAVCFTCRTALRRNIDILKKLRQRRAQSTNGDPTHKKPKQAARQQPEQVPTPNNVPTLNFWQRLGPLTRAAQAYARAQRKRPYVTQVCTSLFIYLCSDISAQSMSGKDYDPTRTARSLLVGSISAIPSYRWFVWLSDNFNYPSRVLSIAAKVIVNQICFTPVFNTYFFGMQALLSGANPAETWERIRQTVPVSCLNSCKLWPAVTAFSFALLPLEYRPVFGGVIAVGWQTYLSYLNRLAERRIARQAEGSLAAALGEKVTRWLGPAIVQKMAGTVSPARRLLAAAFRPIIRPQPRLGNHIPHRLTSTTSRKPPSTARTMLATSVLAAIAGITYYYTTDTRASLHQWLVPRVLRVLFPDAEDAHHAGTAALKALYSLGLHPRERPSALPFLDSYPASSSSRSSPLAVTVFGTTLANPIGISAGLDKDAEIPDPLFALGAGVVEVGGCTPLPQEGNPRPRVFRIPAVDGLINRYGLNSRGADAMAARLRDRLRRLARRWGLTEREVLDGEGGVPPGSLAPGRLLCVQIAKNKKTDERDMEAVIRDHVYCVQRLAPYADVLVVNVSSPNTPGLRDLQAAGPLARLLGAVVDEAKRTDRKAKPRVMVKVSPDEDDDTQMEGVVQAVWMSGVDGVIVGNTTKRRTGLVKEGVRLTGKEQKALAEDGGFSGPAMFDRTLSLVARYRKMLDSYSHKAAGVDDAFPGQKVIFATGGITNGDQALKILNAGASVAMVYTGLVYGGSGTITRIKKEMSEKLAIKEA